MLVLADTAYEAIALLGQLVDGWLGGLQRAQWPDQASASAVLGILPLLAGFLLLFLQRQIVQGLATTGIT